MRKTVVLVVNLMVTCAMTGFVGAVVPTTMTVQGRLADTSNNPVPAGSKDFTFKTYDEEVGGNEIWPHAAGEDQTLVTDDDGLWTAVLGTILPLSDLVFKNTSTWLEVTVDDGINPPETLPRVQLNTSPYTFRSVVSDQAEVANSLSSNTYLPRSGGEMTGPITNTGDPAIIMGKENFGSNNSNIGGYDNAAAGDYAFAAGRHAKANHDGAFVWGDATDADFASTAANQFLVRAAGGVGIGSNNPGSQTALEVSDGAVAAYTEMIRLKSATVPDVSDDVVTIEMPDTSPDNCQFIECERGAVIEFRVHGDGDVTANGTFTGGGADFAEMMSVSTGALSVEPGDVMVIDPSNPRALTQSVTARSTLVAGIYRTEPGFIGSPRKWDQVAIEKGLIASAGPKEELAAPSVLEVAAAIGEIPLAVIGIVPCKVSAENGAIRPGDLLVTSSIPGYAMRDDVPKNGTILGKALGTLDSGTGSIDVLVTLQ